MHFRLPLIAVFILLCACTESTESTKSTESTQTSARPDQIKLINVPAMLADAAQRRPLDTDISFPVDESARASLHIHALGSGQRTPLHTHQDSNEVTLILDGSPITRHWYGESGELQTYADQRPGNTLLSIPPGAGHEWENPIDGFQANLVYSSPGFKGNLYVRESAPQLLAGAAPTIVPLSWLQTQTGESGIMDLGLPGVSAVLVESELVLPLATDARYLYVMAGSATLNSGNQEAAVSPGYLIVVPAQAELKITTQEPLQGYLFKL